MLETDYSVRQICESLGFNRSLFSYQPKQPPLDENVLRAEIQRLAAAYPRYGYRRITEMLVRQGYPVGYRRVARLMKATNLSVSIKRTSPPMTVSQGGCPWSNRLQTLDITRRDQVWVADITYVRTPKHFVYLSLLMDVFTRMIRGWQLSRHLTQSLTLQPLERPLCESVPEIHHSDQGAQYLSRAYVSTLRRHRVEISVASQGQPWENGYAERLIRTLKEEEVSLNDYENISDARKRIGHFLEHVYTSKRPHSALGYLTPMEFERQNLS